MFRDLRHFEKTARSVRKFRPMSKNQHCFAKTDLQTFKLHIASVAKMRLLSGSPSKRCPLSAKLESNAKAPPLVSFMF